MADQELDSKHLRDITSKMVDAITSPAYVEAMRAVKSAPQGKRLDEALRRLTPEALRSQGVPLPEGMRISSRYFEASFAPVEVGEPGGQRNLLKELHGVEPDVINALERLREKNPSLFDDLRSRLSPGDLISPVALCGCACGGAATVCGGAGGG